MIVRRCLLAAVAVLAVSARVALAQPAPDCGKAQTAAEKTICGNPELAAVDAAMATAYATLLSKILPPAQQAGLQTSQRQWVGARDAACSEAKDAALAPCLFAETGKRRRFLAGTGANGPTAAPKLLPSFFDQTKKDAYEISVEYPQFAAPADGEFNHLVRDLTIDEKTLSEYRQVEPQRTTGASNFYQVTYETIYLDPHLALVTLQFSAYSGGAHPNTWRLTVLWDPASDKPVALADYLADPKAAVPAIGAVCRDKLAVEAKAEDWDFFDNADFGAVVGDARSWAIDKEGVTIVFNPYSVAAYVVGPRDCRLSYAELTAWLKPGGVLPPR
jgi:uncharacterized protein YecT (DUF1311 family)